MARNTDYFFQCTDCGSEYPGLHFIYLCPECEKMNQKGHPMKGVLKVVYDYQRIKNSGKGDLSDSLFVDLFPLESFKSWPNLRIGNTPFYHYPLKNINSTLFLKDDSQNPTFSFKDRASGLVSAYAVEHGIDTIAAASTGNAGSSLAGICAANGQKSIIYVPSSAPVAKLVQIMSYGAQIIKVEGNYDMAFDLSLEATKTTGVFNRNTAYNPLTIEGKKTASFEMFRDLGFKAPDFIFVSSGDGVILSGIYKGFEDLLHLDLIEQMPVIFAVQAEGSPNLVNNLDTEKFTIESSGTIADSISVDVPRNFYMAKKFIKTYKGKGILVNDAAIIDAIGNLASDYGLFTEPASAAAYAGYLQYRESTGFPDGSRIVVQLTGSGLKDISAVLKNV